jgi:hypothetical protein
MSYPRPNSLGQLAIPKEKPHDYILSYTTVISTRNNNGIYSTSSFLSPPSYPMNYGERIKVMENKQLITLHGDFEKYMTEKHKKRYH